MLSAGDTSSYFYLPEGILYRSFTKGSLSVSQVVVPKGLRSAVLAVSHDAILAGHSGARRTLARVRSSFFWPGVTVDVSQNVKSCDVCQKTTPKLAMQNSSAASQRNKKYYDKKTQDRRFSGGEEVLVFVTFCFQQVAVQLARSISDHKGVSSWLQSLGKREGESFPC